jgi:hypothetical protein
MREKSGMTVGVVEIGYGCIDEAGSAGAKIGGDGGEFFSAAGDQEEACTLGGPDTAGGFGDS